MGFDRPVWLSTTVAVGLAVAYEGSIEDAAIEGLPGTFSMGDGRPVREADSNEVAGSICRLPDHADSGDDDRDWSACIPTPGSANHAPTAWI